MRPARTSKKRAQLVEAAKELFRRFGMKRVSVGEVCDAAGVSKVTFYKHFSNKTDLARAVVELLSDRIVARIDEIEALKAPVEQRVALLVEERVRMAREWSPEFIEELYRADAELAELVRERAARTRARYVEFIRSAQRAGGMRREIHPDLLMAVIDRLYALGGDEALVQRVGGYERLTRDVNRLLFYGALSRD